MYCRLPNFVSWKRIGIVILPNSVDFLVVKVWLACFYFLKSDWLFVWAVQNLRLHEALSCNSTDTLRLECQGLLCWPSKLWGRLKAYKNTDSSQDLQTEACTKLFMETLWAECCPQWDSTWAVPMSRVLTLQLHKMQQQE